MRVTAKGGDIRDENGRQLLVVVPTNCSKKFRDRMVKTLVGIINSEERGKDLASAKPDGGGNG